MNAKETLQKFIPIINDVITTELDNMFSSAENVSPLMKELADYIKPIMMNGKRLRGAFVYYSYLMHGGKNESDALKAAAYTELIHSYILIMDDVIDKDDKRRGTETVHKIYKDIHEKRYSKRDAAHFGNSVAICAGLIMNHFTQNILLNTSIDPEILRKSLILFNNAIAFTGYGEALDVIAESQDEVTLEEAEHIMLLKTAMYTYENPLQFGAMLAGASDEQIKALSKFAIPGGIAFQIQDDIIGMFGDEDKTGKPADSDLKEGKMNVLTIKTIQMLEGKDKKRFLSLLGNEEITSGELEEARELIIKSGSLDYSKKRAQDLVQEAVKAIEGNQTWQGEGREFLLGIAQYMIERDL